MAEGRKSGRRAEDSQVTLSKAVTRSAEELSQPAL